MTGILWNFVSFIVALGVLVAVHEFGHFWVARKCGVKVIRFSIGFGKSLWKRTAKDGTEYTLSLIPLGGYVKMLDGRVEDVPDSLRSQAFDQQGLGKRAAIVAAGPIFNFLFAIVAYWAVFMMGIPAVKPVVGSVEPSSIVAQAGLQPNMQIMSVSGVDTPDWETVNMELVAHIGDSSMTMTVATPDSIGSREKLNIDLTTWNFDPEKESAIKALGFTPYTPEIKTAIAQVTEDGAAMKAGLAAGDEIIRLNDQPVDKWQALVDTIKQSANIPLTLTVLRNGEEQQFTLIPDAKTLKSGKVIGFAGIAPQVGNWPDGYRFEMQYGPVESIGKAIDKTGQLISLTASMLKKLVVGDVGLNNLSGPISIAKGAGTTAEYGLVYFLGFMALISVNLGIINLVPMPMLDGGHLMFFAIEAVIRRPVPEKVQEMGYRIGGAIIFSLMAIAIFNDFTRL
ncbi:sigma E protease regulator RseP [Vibrio viridaestus]|uniref:Zinc metalloprotease n=1 Tax=Vibrio viridaestus TaxID=2487322 RepID=A0A3N9U730_9VIBR|nr:sigma E protease regulator RseP [Vibrio viridaestus]RQW63946.1 sigma E protease regulator RseP [Vibrio viridaestus]